MQDGIKECENDQDKYDILINYNNTLEEFIDLFDTKFDNETMVEKFYLYVKELFISYDKTLNMEGEISIDEEVKKNIIDKTKKYILEFITKSSGYLNNLVETIKTFPKKLFYEIITYIMEKFNECGKKCLKENKKFCKYNSLIYFQKAKYFFDNYIEVMSNIMACDISIMKNCKLQFETFENYIHDLISGVILLGDDSLKTGKLISEGKKMENSLIFGNKDKEEKNAIILENYEHLLADCQKKNLKNLSKEEEKKLQEQEAICIANIIKINYKILGKKNYNYLCLLGEKCESIANKLIFDQKVEWHKEFKEIYEEIKQLNESMTKDKIKDNIKNIYKKEFDEIEEKFIKKANKNEFIEYILETTPYDGYEEDKSNNILNFGKEKEAELINYLRKKYNPNNYKFSDNQNEQLRFYKIEFIEEQLNKSYDNINL